MKKIIRLTESELQNTIKKIIMELFDEKDEYLKYLDKHNAPWDDHFDNELTKENLKDHIDDIFIPKAYIKDIFTDEPLGKGNHYKLRKVFTGYASFDDLDDRSTWSYKYNRQPIVKVHIDDVLQNMELEKSKSDEL